MTAEAPQAMEAEVGATAGRVWKYLEANGEVPAIRVRAALEIPNSLLYMAVGWLARENKVQIRPSEKGFLLSLRR